MSKTICRAGRIGAERLAQQPSEQKTGQRRAGEPEGAQQRQACRHRHCDPVQAAAEQPPEQIGAFCAPPEQQPQQTGGLRPGAQQIARDESEQIYARNRERHAGASLPGRQARRPLLRRLHPARRKGLPVGRPGRLVLRQQQVDRRAQRPGQPEQVFRARRRHPGFPLGHGLPAHADDFRQPLLRQSAANALRPNPFRQRRAFTRNHLHHLAFSL